MRHAISSVQLSLTLLLTPAGLAFNLTVPNGIAQVPADPTKVPDLGLPPEPEPRLTVKECLAKLEGEWKKHAQVAFSAHGPDFAGLEVTSQYPPPGVDAPLNRSIFLRVSTGGLRYSALHLIVNIVMAALAVGAFIWVGYLKGQMRAMGAGTELAKDKS
jgi:hypothetical protein